MEDCFDAPKNFTGFIKVYFGCLYYTLLPRKTTAFTELNKLCMQLNMSFVFVEISVSGYPELKRVFLRNVCVSSTAISSVKNIDIVYDKM